MIKAAVSGACGRMGSAILRVINGTNGIQVTGAFERSGSDVIGVDAGEVAGIGDIGIIVTDNIAEADFDVLIEFTNPSATREHIEVCRDLGAKMVIGTTGLSDDDIKLIDEASKSIAIIQAANTSIGINLCINLLKQAAITLGDQADVEIIEAHHRHKVDAPSGTALLLGQSIAEALNKNLKQDAVFSREGMIGERKPGSIGFSTIRGGEIAGEHTVMFIGDSERLEITHRTTNSKIFPEGAVRAAIWLTQHEKGLFNMQDVLGLH